MTHSVEVSLHIPIINPEVRQKLDEEFRQLHDQTFKQEVNIKPQKEGSMKGEVKEMKHGLGIWVDAQTFFIPCHWDYNHMVQTQKDIKKVLKKFGLKARTRLSY